MTPTNPYLQEVIDAHIEIEAWLSGRASADRLSPLLARFSPAFQMISPQGKQIDAEGLAALFGGGHGARAGLQIALDELAEVSSWPGGAVISYREQQTQANGELTVRRSTAVLEKNNEGSIIWRRLHETFIAA